MSMSANIIRSNLPVISLNVAESRVQRPNQTVPIEYPSMAPRSDSNPSIFRHTFQSGFLSILYAIGHRPLELWEKQVRNGYVKRVTDADIRSLVIEIISSNVGTTFITSPVSPGQSLGVRLPILVFVVKNMKRYFAYEIQVMDETKTRRRFSVSNFHPVAKVKPFSVNIPLKLDDGWNQVSVNLADLTRKVFGQEYKETTRVQIHANCRIRRVYFCNRLYGENEVPLDFKLLMMSASPKDSDLNASIPVTSGPEPMPFNFENAMPSIIPKNVPKW